VAQYVGDGILAYFGYPRAHEDDAERALRAALEIVGAPLPNLRQESTPQVHIGVATGVVVIGDLTDTPHTAAREADPGGVADVSAVGSAPNLAARLQTLADPGTVVASEQTRRLAGGIFEYVDLGSHKLKGFDTAIHAWQVVSESHVRSRFQALRAGAMTPLVDRQIELRNLRDMWSAVRAGQGGAVLLSSEPGVGKSRLTEEVANNVAGSDCLRVWYYCSSHLQSTPLAPVIRQLSLAAGFADRDDTDRKLRKLRVFTRRCGDGASDIVPLLASLLAIPYESRYPALQMSVQRQKHRLFEVLMHLLEAHARRQPMLLVVEDLHWIDPSTDELIGVLIDRIKSLPVLALLTARPEFQSHWDDKPQLLSMPLQPLEHDDSIAMIESLCANRGIPAPTIRQIADKTDGLPLFIEDVTRDLLDVVANRPIGRGAVAGDARADLAIPATLTDSLTARLDRLGPAKRVAQIGAVIGREFSYELLAKVADIPGETLREDLHRLVESGLLLRSRATDVLIHGFKHALVRDAAYASLLRKERVALHARIANVLVDEFPETTNEQPELVAHHFEAAEDADRAVFHLIKAAELATRRSGFLEATTHLKRGLGLLDALPQSESRMRKELSLYVALGDVNAEYRGFSADESGDAYHKALALCRELGDARGMFPILSRAGSFHITRAEFRQCRSLGEECLARAAVQALKPPFVMGHRMLGGVAFLTGEFREARRHLEDALAYYEQDEGASGVAAFDVQDQKSSVLCYLALTLSIMGFPRSGLRAAEDSLAHSRALGDPHTVNFSLCFLAAVHHIQRDSSRALVRASESLDLAREQRFATWIGISQMIRGGALIQNGRCAEGLGEIRAGMDAHKEMAAGAYQPFGISLLVEGLMVDGHPDEALGALDQALAISGRTGERFYIGELLRLKGAILAKKGNVAEAEYWLRQSHETARQQHARLFELRSAADLCDLLDSPAREAMVRETIEPLCQSFEEGIDVFDVRRARAIVAGASSRNTKQRS
jgi:predicted ATPase